MNYAVEFAAEARKDFARLDRERKSKIASRIDQLALDPYEPRISEQLHGLENLRKSRLGDRRIVYLVNRLSRVISIVSIRPRGQAYRKLQRKL